MDPTARRRPHAALIVSAALAIVIACGDPYLHTNPYDPAYPVSVSLTGPDTLFSYEETATFSLVTSPAFPDTSAQFSVSDSVVFPPNGFATFRSNAPPLYPLTRTVTVNGGVGAFETTAVTAGGGDGVAQLVTVWRHSAYKLVVLTQRVTSIQLRCPDVHACSAASVGGTWSVWVDGYDALSQLIVALHSSVANPSTGTPIATFISRDTTIASVSPVGVRVANVTALKTGTTWVVATRGTLLDSLQLTVH